MKVAKGLAAGRPLADVPAQTVAAGPPAAGVAVAPVV